MASKRKEKKSETLEVRLPHSKKEAFMEACEREGITASHAVRTFIDAYLKRSRRVKLKQITEEITMKLIQNPVKTLGAVGATFTGALLLTALPSAAEDRDAQPIAPPSLTYPVEMLTQTISGDCESTFDVSKEGLPENITATCSHPGFIEAVISSAATLRFAPKLVDGKPVRHKGVTYPITFEVTADDPAVDE